MNWLVFHIVSGHSFFSGLLMLVVASIIPFAARRLKNNRLAKRLGNFLICLGMILIAVSSTPIPYWCYGAIGLAFIFGVASQFAQKLRRASTIVLISVCLFAGILEAPWHFNPQPIASADRSLTIIGDSVTAGLGGKSEQNTWPNLLASKHNLVIQDVSHVGETASSAFERVRNLQADLATFIIIEIGGNDLLGSTSSSKFDEDLDDLLSFVARPGRQIIMFELPLPPFCNAYGQAQRRQALKHGVMLIPKRVFFNILNESGATLDSIHLSPAGHQKMAATVWNLIKQAFEN